MDFDHLAGFAWAENVGWLNMGNGGGPYPNDSGDSSTFGVNLNPDTGDLSGFAWGENIGWINFDTSAARGMDGARFDNHNRRFVGFVWGENIGWINLNDAEHFVAIGPCDHGDFECDGDVELDDYAAFKSVFFGPNVPVESTAFDADADADIDLFDFSAMQTLITVQ